MKNLSYTGYRAKVIQALETDKKSYIKKYGKKAYSLLYSTTQKFIKKINEELDLGNELHVSFFIEGLGLKYAK